MLPRPTSDTGLLSLQVNIICLLLALVGATAIVQHPQWFGGVPQVGRTAAPHTH
jgi:hypothetical protein